MEASKYTTDEIRAGVKQLLADLTEREPADIPDTASFADDLGVDSIMAMEMMVAMDKKYKIDIPEEEFMKIKNVDDAVASIERHVGLNH